MELAQLEARLRAARELGDDAGCLEILAEIEATDPQNGRWAYARGVHLQDLGRLEEAEAAYRQATEWRPEHAWSWTNLGRLLDDRCAWSEALACYDRAIALPAGADDAITWTNRGNTLMSLERFEDALASFERALLSEPAEGPALLGRNTVLAWMGRIDEANAHPARRGRAVQLTHPLSDGRLVARWWVGRHTMPDALERAARNMLETIAGLEATPPGLADGVRVQWGWSPLTVRRRGDDVVLCEPDFAGNPWRELAWDVSFTLQTDLMHSMTASITSTEPCACRMQDQIAVVWGALGEQEVTLHRRHATDADGVSGWLIGPSDEAELASALENGEWQLMRTGELTRARHALIKALCLPVGYTVRFDAHAIVSVLDADGQEVFA